MIYRQLRPQGAQPSLSDHTLAHHPSPDTLPSPAVGHRTREAPRPFAFKDPTGVNKFQFTSDAPRESITGTGTGSSGSVTFDPAQPAATKGKITLETKSLNVGNPMMADHLRGENWLDVAKHPTITFEAVSLGNVRPQGNVVTADVAG